MAKLSDKELELYGFNNDQIEFIKSNFLSFEEGKNFDKLIKEYKSSIAKSEKEIQKEGENVAKLKEECEKKADAIWEEKDPREEYHDAALEYGRYCLKNNIDFDLHSLDLPGEGSLFYVGEMMELENIVPNKDRDPNHYEKFKALDTKIDNLKKEVNKHPASYYSQEETQKRVDEVMKPYENAQNALEEKQNNHQISKDSLEFYESINETFKAGYSNDKVVNKYLDAEEKYKKINPISKFFSHFLPNTWTAAGRARDDLNFYKAKSQEMGNTETFIDSIREARKQVKDSAEPTKETAVEKQSIAQLEAETVELNSSSSYVEKEAKSNEKALEKTSEL